MGITHSPVLISVILCTLFVFLLPLGQCQQQVIYVSKRSTAINNHSCWTGGPSLPCSNFTLALGGGYNTSGSVIQIDSSYGPYQLDPSPYSSFRGVHSVQMLAAGGGQVEIECSNGAGLSFFSTSDISIVNISFIGCGVLHNSTSRDFTDTLDYRFQTVNMALSFFGCADVTLKQVSVSKSNGIAVQFYATHGVVDILGCEFIDNPYDASTGTGGAVYIEFPFCLPDGCLQVSPVLVSYSNYTIKDCLFVNNTASSDDMDSGIFMIPVNESNSQFGKGGGISISFKGNSSSNEVLVINSRFTSNKAVMSGGGIYIDFQDTAHANTVEVRDTTVENCRAKIGGGVTANFFEFEKLVTSNSVYLTSSNFTNNTACAWGGAVSLYMTHMADSTNSIVLSRCNLTNNRGSYGSATSFSLWHSSPHLLGPSAPLLPIVDNCRFAHNSDTKAPGSQEMAQFGALYLDHVSVQFTGTMEFVGNFGAGTVAVAAKINFTEHTTVKFINNTAVRGAAIGLLGSAVMIVSPNTSYLFENNSASQLGGAIYADIIGERTPLSRNCFMQYSVFNTPPEEWEVQFTFVNNTIDGNDRSKANSIYAPSILPCLRENLLEIFPKDYNITRRVFCWNETTWNYTNHTCWEEIQTAAAVLDIPPILQVTAGKSASMNITAWDDLNNNITDYLVLTAQSETSAISIDRRSHYISSNTIDLHLDDNNKTGELLSIHLQTLPERVLTSPLNVTFKQCTAGLKLVTSKGTCEFVGNYKNYLRFNLSSGYAEIFRGYWIGNSSDGVDVAGFCLYCNGFSTRHNSTDGGYIPLDFTIRENRECLEGNRMGFLCSQCQPNYSTAIFANDLQCKNTSQVHNGIVWTVYAAVHLLYYVLLAVFIVYTNISFTAAPLNAAIIFAQMVSTVVNVNDGGIVPLWEFKTVAKIYVCLYDLFNLNVFHPLFHDLTISVPLPIAYLFVSLLPLWMLLLVIVIWGGIFFIASQRRKFNNLYLRYLNKLTAYFHLFDISEALSNTLSSFLLLSCTSLLTVLLQLLNPTFLRDSDARIVETVFYLDPATQYDVTHFYFLFPLLVVLLILFPALVTIAFCRYRDDQLSKRVTPSTLIDHILAPLQSHFKRYQDRENQGEENHGWTQCVRLTEDETDCPYEINCGCSRKQCCAGLVVFSFSDFHWVPAAYVILRMILILIFDFAWNFMMRCIMQLVTLVVAASLIIIFRPYKQEWINILDAVIFLDLALLIGLSAYQYHLTAINITLSGWAYAFQLILIFIPFCWIALYIGARLVARFKRKKQTRNGQKNGQANGQDHGQVNGQDAETQRLVNGLRDGHPQQNSSYSV